MASQMLDHHLKGRDLTQSAFSEHAAHESKEAKVVDTKPHYHQRGALESRYIRFEITTMDRSDSNLRQVYNS